MLCTFQGYKELQSNFLVWCKHNCHLCCISSGSVTTCSVHIGNIAGDDDN